MLRLTLLLLLCLPAPASATATVPGTAEKIGPHSYYVRGLPGAAARANQGFMSNAGFVVTRAGVVVFDSLGTPVLAPWIDELDLRDKMGRAASDFMPFEAAFAAADWSRWVGLPAYDEAHRRNAYNTYLLMEREALAQ